MTAKRAAGRAAPAGPTTYDLYLESGPRRRKTMVHVLQLLGCVAVGATTDQAVATAPNAIRAYLRFLRRHGEAVDPASPFATQVAEHITQGQWLGHGSPNVMFSGDYTPLTDDEIDLYLKRLHALRETLAAWAAAQTDQQLEAAPKDGGRPDRAVLLHILIGPGSYLGTALGGAPGYSAVYNAVERGKLDVADGLRRVAAMADKRLRATTSEERTQMRELRSGPRSLRRGVRRMLEHDWEHLAELARRPGGPVW